MNPAHLEFSASDMWRDLLRDEIIPWVVDTIDLGDDVLEVGPGPGLTTDLFRERLPRLTSVEIDADLAANLAARLAGTNVDVVHGDATALMFDAGRFTGAISFTMLHHVPTAAQQDLLFAEVARVLRPGAPFVATDSVASDDLAAFHTGDTYNPVDPTTIEVRLLARGFASADVRTNEFGWAVTARTPA